MAVNVLFLTGGLPHGSRVNTSGGGSDLVVNVGPEEFPHFTFHANGANVLGGTATVAYAGNVARYHVAIRRGVYVGRQYLNGQWQADPGDTNTNFQSDLDTGNSFALDLEPILRFS